MAEDYFKAMERVEQWLGVAAVAMNGSEKPVIRNIDIDKELHQVQLFLLVEKLAQPKLCYSERLEVVTQLKRFLVPGQQKHPPPW